MRAPAWFDAIVRNQPSNSGREGPTATQPIHSDSASHKVASIPIADIGVLMIGDAKAIADHVC